MIEQAKKYALNGNFIFPLQVKGKAPATPRGFKDASNAHAQVERWWTLNPKANIGLPTGKINGVEVLDIDRASDGFVSLRELYYEYGELNSSYVVRSGGGGLHFYFQYSGRDYRSSVGIYPGIDFRTDGGYVVAPPSIHSSGYSYEHISFSWDDFLRGEYDA